MPLKRKGVATVYAFVGNAMMWSPESMIDVWFEKNSKRCKGGKYDVGKFEKCDVCNTCTL